MMDFMTISVLKDAEERHATKEVVDAIERGNVLKSKYSL